MLSEGFYQAKLKGYNWQSTKSGSLQFRADFEVYSNEGAPVSIAWFGNMSNEIGKEILFKTLDVLGFSGSDLTDLADGSTSGLLDTDKMYNVKLVNEVYEGKTRTKIKWIGEGTPKAFNNMPVQEVRKTIASLNLNNDWKAFVATKDLGF